MQPDDKLKESLDFVTRHYRHGAFDTEKSLKQLLPYRRHRLSVAAAIAGAVVLTASAIGIWQYSVNPDRHEVDTTTATEVTTAIEAKKIRIEFENAPLPTVVRRIEKEYGVSIKNMPADAESLTLTLGYEGTATELIDVINSLLGTEMEVDQ